jgi:hypothetical protein
MGVQAFQKVIERGELLGVAALIYYRCSLDRAGSGEAIRRAGIRSSAGSQSDDTDTALNRACDSIVATCLFT